MATISFRQPAWLTVTVKQGSFRVLAREPSTKAAVRWAHFAAEAKTTADLFRPAAEHCAKHVRAVDGLDVPDYPDTEEERIEWWMEEFPPEALFTTATAVTVGETPEKSDAPGD